MNSISEFFCIVKSNQRDDAGRKIERNVRLTFRWSDEYGNSIAPFFTSLECGLSFLKTLDGWHVKRYSVSDVIGVILANIRQETAFFSIDPVTTQMFVALSPAEFLTELVLQEARPGGRTQVPALENEDIIPMEALVGEGRDRHAEVEYRRLLAVADVIFGIDVLSGQQSLVFGRVSLEELIRTGHSNILGVVNIGLGREFQGIEKLAVLVKDIKGRHDYCVTRAT